VVSNGGGQGSGSWGLVTNAAGEAVPALDFNVATLAQIESLFKFYGTVRYEPQERVRLWLTSSTAPKPFANR
jgi:glucan 1,3-beta-glucosidase